MNSADKPITATEIDEAHVGSGVDRPGQEGHLIKPAAKALPNSESQQTDGASRAQLLASIQKAVRQVWPTRAPDTD